MSAYDGYDDEPRRYRNVRTRPRERDEPDLVREEVYIERGKGPGPRGAELVYRGRDDSTEDIPRDFPPPGRGSRRSEYGDYSAPRRSKSTGGRRYDDDYYSDDDRYTDYAGPAAAGAAGYAAGRGRYDRERRHKRDDRDYESEYSNSPPRRERKKSGVGELLGSLGLGGLVGGLAGGNKDKDRSRSRSGSRGGRAGRSRSRGARSRRGPSSDGSGRSRSRGGNSERKWAQAAQAALVAGAVEAFRSRKTPGPWTGEKGKRIATAALGAGGIDGLVSGKDPGEKSKRHLAGAVIGGLGINRAANGARSQVRGGDSRSVSPDGRPRSRSRSIIDRFRGRSQSRGRNSEAGGGGNGALGKGLLGAGAAAVAGKALFDRVRSKSRKRRSPSNSSSDSYVPSRTRQRDRRRSPRSDTASTRRTDGPVLRGGQDDRALARGGNRYAAAAGAGAGAGAGALAVRSGGGGGDRNGNQDANGKGDGNSSDSSSTADMEKTRKHVRGKEIITATLASVATIHAAHGVYSSMEAHEKRHKLVAEGEMSPEQARKQQTKAWIQDAAAVGIAALGIKGAFSEWKQMNDQRREIQDIERKKVQRRKKRIAEEKAKQQQMQERLLQAFEHNPVAAMGYQAALAGGVAPQTQAPPQPDLSGNPYAPRDGGNGNQRY
ncbi:uncharacterized protein RCC_08558 [Ramularia collo-cygni]|uniref:Uncharacterized protein n=1 Tax=Ramularia collo-cygni TaxID=112498 RepID=A0A2D3VCV1_9PEZI|nr:uncharacterized protein RCC_08558 [Ramularia collo-cygni]CZT22852.1 uncharacterized protein RCC_08558 [Ramularia collo-cygni]